MQNDTKKNKDAENDFLDEDDDFGFDDEDLEAEDISWDDFDEEGVEAGEPAEDGKPAKGQKAPREKKQKTAAVPGTKKKSSSALGIIVVLAVLGGGGFYVWQSGMIDSLLEPSGAPSPTSVTLAQDDTARSEWQNDGTPPAETSALDDLPMPEPMENQPETDIPFDAGVALTPLTEGQSADNADTAAKESGLAPMPGLDEEDETPLMEMDLAELDAPDTGMLPGRSSGRDEDLLMPPPAEEAGVGEEIAPGFPEVDETSEDMTETPEVPEEVWPDSPQDEPAGASRAAPLDLPGADIPPPGAEQEPGPAMQMASQKPDPELLGKIAALEKQNAALLDENKAATGKIEDLNAEIARLENRIRELDAADKAAQQTPAVPGSKPLRPEQSFEPGGSGSASETGNPVEEVSVSRTSETNPAWILKSAKPGQAVIEDPESGNFITVETGSSVKGIGTVTAIEPQNGKWVIQGTQGQISQ